MESKKKTKAAAIEFQMVSKYSTKTEPGVNMFSAGAVAMEDARESLQEQV